MRRLAALVAIALSLAACGIIDTLVDGWKHVKAIEADLEKSTGVQPQVGFNWSNGRLLTVTVTFPELYQAKPLSQLADTVRHSVTSEFKQTPDKIVLGFAITAATPGRTAQSHAAAADSAFAL